MATKGVIKSSNFSNTWSGPKGSVEYHKLTFEGDEKTYQIGAKDKNPAFLAVGQTLWYEAKDEKGGIKRVEAPQSVGVGASAISAAVAVDTTVKDALSNAALLVAHGIVKPDQLETVAKRFIELTKTLKAE